MPTRIKLGPFEATIIDFEWASPQQHIADLLNAFLPPNGPSGADPNPDATAAQNAADFFGGEVIEIEPVDYEPGRVY